MTNLRSYVPTITVAVFGRIYFALEIKTEQQSLSTYGSIIIFNDNEYYRKFTIVVCQSFFFVFATCQSVT